MAVTWSFKDASRDCGRASGRNYGRPPLREERPEAAGSALSPGKGGAAAARAVSLNQALGKQRVRQKSFCGNMKSTKLRKLVDDYGLVGHRVVNKFSILIVIKNAAGLATKFKCIVYKI